MHDYNLTCTQNLFQQSIKVDKHYINAGMCLSVSTHALHLQAQVPTLKENLKMNTIKLIDSELVDLKTDEKRVCRFTRLWMPFQGAEETCKYHKYAIIPNTALNARTSFQEAHFVPACLL